jgi:cytochrome c oxidase subunit 4
MSMTSHSAATEPLAHARPHAVPARVLLGVFVALLLLTAATVSATHIDLGPWNVALALGIAVVKATLVLLYFMHLRYERLFYAIILTCALLFIMLFITLALTDTTQYQHELRAAQTAEPGAP